MTDSVFNQALFRKTVEDMPMDVLSGLRKTAADKFVKSGFPTTRHEDWRYTNLARAISTSNDWLASAGLSPHSPTQSAQSLRSAIDAHWILIQNGKIEFDNNVFPSGVSVTVLSDKASGASCEKVAIDDSLAQLNAALLID